MASEKPDKPKRIKTPRKQPEVDPAVREARQRVTREALGLLLGMTGIFIMVCILTPDSFGFVGESIHYSFTYLFGWAAYLFPILAAFTGISLKFRKKFISLPLFIISIGVFFLAAVVFFHLTYSRGGIAGSFLGGGLIRIIGTAGSYFLVAGLGLLCIMFTTGLTYNQLKETTAPVLGFLGRESRRFYRFLAIKHDDEEDEGQLLKVPDLSHLEETYKEEEINEEEEEEDEGFEEDVEETEPDIDTVEEKITPPSSDKAPDTTEINIPAHPVPAVASVAKEGYKYKLPPIDLLSTVEKIEEEKSAKDYSQLLEETLADFGVDVKVINRVRGPTVTRYELQPAKGVKVKKITNLSNDIALALAAYSIRIEAPIPGKSAIGIEIPNHSIDPIFLRDTLVRGKYRKQPPLSLALGKDITGKSIMDNLLKMPHLLIAGATGSGKSVCLNCVIASILFRCTPDEVQMVMIDPKRVELSLFEGIPHLVDINLADGKKIITDPKAATMALKTISEIMDQRYEDFVKMKVRNIKEFNERAEIQIPYIVVVIDELADLMMVSSSTVEQHICRIAQLGRASGIHLIVATQRPSVDVITGLIKANIPSRIAFAVSSQVDSRTILDRVGAEKLLGKGDMLYLPVDANEPRRIQGAYVSGEEIEKAVEFWKQQPRPQNAIPIEICEEEPDKKGKGVSKTEMSDQDELIPEAIEIIRQTRQASVSNLQRKMKIGYARAGRIMDQLEKMGLVGPADGSKPRKIIIPGFNDIS